ncbi:MAG: stalk domain-containing protein [Desulfotomaculales bacterium]
MRRRFRLLCTLLATAFLLFSVAWGALGAGKGSPSHGQQKERLQNEVKTRTQNAGDDFRLRVEQKIESGVVADIKELVEDLEDELRDETEGQTGDETEGNTPTGSEEDANGSPEDGQGSKGKIGLQKLMSRLEQSLQEKPGDPQLLWQLAVVYRNVGEYDKAIEVLKDLQTQMTHPTAKVAVLLAQCLRAKGDPQAALVELQNLLATATVPGAVYAYKAILKQELGLAEEAAEDIEEAIAAEPEDEDFYGLAGELYETMGEKGVKVFVKGKKIRFDVAPFIANNRTMVPIRAVVEALGLEVGYDAGAATVTITNPADGKTVVLYLGQKKAIIGNRETTLDTPAKIVPPGRTVVPLRFLSEAFGKDVNWFENGQIAAINEP